MGEEDEGSKTIKDTAKKAGKDAARKAGKAVTKQIMKMIKKIVSLFIKLFGKYILIIVAGALLIGSVWYIARKASISNVLDSAREAISSMFNTDSDGQQDSRIF